MTVNELIEELQRRKAINPDCGDWEVLMAGHDANGDRHYDISVTALYLEERAQKCVLWDD